MSITHPERLESELQTEFAPHEAIPRNPELVGVFEIGNITDREDLRTGLFDSLHRLLADDKEDPTKSHGAVLAYTQSPNSKTTAQVNSVLAEVLEGTDALKDGRFAIEDGSPEFWRGKSASDERERLIGILSRREHFTDGTRRDCKMWFLLSSQQS